MSRGFENIFEKYNLSREVPSKRHRSTKTQSNTFHKKGLQISTKIEAGDSISCSSVPIAKRILNLSSSRYLNSHSKAKYNIPTRYNRLEVIEVCSKAKPRNDSLGEYFAFDKNDHKCYSKENTQECPSFANNQTPFDTLRNDHLSQIRTALGSVGNNDMKRNNTTDYLKISGNKYRRKNNEDALFEMNETNVFLTDTGHQKSSDTDNSRDPTSQNTQYGPSELDLLIDLIEKEEKVKKAEHPRDKQNGKDFKCDERLLVTKPRLKGGCQEMFELSLKHAKTKTNFLKYDKKIGLRNGQLLTVVKLDTFHGVTLATVESPDLNKNLAVTVATEMALRLKLGSRIEAFFDETTLPYKLLLNGEYIDVYIEPYKLLVT